MSINPELIEAIAAELVVDASLVKWTGSPKFSTYKAFDFLWRNEFSEGVLVADCLRPKSANPWNYGDT